MGDKGPLMERPVFIEKLSHAHYARLARCVVLTGNIYDLFTTNKDGKTSFVPLDELIEHALQNVEYPKREVREKFIVVSVKSDGIHVVSDSENNDDPIKKVIEELKGKDSSSLENIQKISKLLRDVADKRIEISKSAINSKSEAKPYIRPLCIIFDQAETIFPNVEPGRANNQTVEAWRWFSDLIRDEDLWPNTETANERSDLIILLSPTTVELNFKIFSLPNTEHIEISLPQSFYGLLSPDLEDDARGLTIRTVNNLVVASKRDPQNSSLTRQVITDEITKRLQLELKDTIKLIRPSHTMKDVIGFSNLKPRLAHLARRIDNLKRAPVGMIVTGHNGTGKTFVLEGWCAGVGRTVLTMAGGMKSKWYGEQGIFLETFENIVTVYNRVCVLIDEAHKAFASIHKSDTYHAEAEYARHILQMMSNPKYRSKVFWVLITTRPDLLDPDFKRSERCSLFVPMCDPEGEDADSFFNWTNHSFEREGIILDEDMKVYLRQKTRKENYEFSAGDYRRLINELIDERDYWVNERKSSFDVKAFIENWKPNAVRIGKERRLHMLLAAKDADWRELLPAKLRDKNEEEIAEEINELKFLANIT